MSSQKPLELRIPRQSPDPAKRFLADPKATAAWLQELPIANIGETARLIYKALTDLNHLEMPDLARARIAEQFREPVRFLGKNLLARYVDAAFPPPSKTRKIALLNREIHSELANAYKIVLSHQSEMPALRLDRKLVALATARALRYLQAVLLHSALVYEPHPPGTWREIHEIFEFSRRLGLDETAVKDGVEPQPGSASPRELYLRSLLFSLVPPYRMRQRDMLSLTDALPGWAPLARLLPLAEARAGGTYFLVSTDRDEPPSCRAADSQEPVAGAYVLTTQGLTQVLRRTIESVPERPDQLLTGSKTPPSLLRHFLQAWAAGPTRRFVRTRLNFDLELVIGMENVHALLRSLSTPPKAEEEIEPGEPDDNSMLEELTQFTASIFSDAEPSSLGMALSDDDSVFLHAQSPRTEPPGSPAWPSKAPPEQQPPATFRLRTINESAGGYCLGWEGQDIPQVKIGEIVGVRSAKHPEQFGIGVVRWMKNEHRSGAQLGVQMLSPGCRALDLRPLDGGPGASPRKGLLLPGHQPSDDVPSILAPPLTFRIGQEMLMDEGPVAHPVRLTEAVETTGAFARFHFEPLEQQPSSLADEDRESDGDFEALWKSL